MHISPLLSIRNATGHPLELRLQRRRTRAQGVRDSFSSSSISSGGGSSSSSRGINLGGSASGIGGGGSERVGEDCTIVEGNASWDDGQAERGGALVCQLADGAVLDDARVCLEGGGLRGEAKRVAADLSTGRWSECGTHSAMS